MQSRMPKRSRHRPRRRIGARTSIAAAMLGGLGLAAPAAAQGVIATGRGRAGATVALIVVLIGVVVGGVALSRSAARNARDGAVVALVLGLIGMALAGLHLATTTGAFYGAGNGRGGAIVALVLGLIGMVLGRQALARSSRAGRRVDHPGMVHPRPEGDSERCPE